jgi:hypothetical protein
MMVCFAGIVTISKCFAYMHFHVHKAIALFFAESHSGYLQCMHVSMVVYYCCVADVIDASYLGH